MTRGPSGLGDLKDRVDKLEAKVDKLEAWRNWMLGVGAVVGVILTAFAKQILAVI
jgi:hypothetical protein